MRGSHYARHIRFGIRNLRTALLLQLSNATNFFSSGLICHRSQKSSVSFTESGVAKHVPRSHELAIAATLVTAVQTGSGVRSGCPPRWGTGQAAARAIAKLRIVPPARDPPQDTDGLAEPTASHVVILLHSRRDECGWYTLVAHPCRPPFLVARYQLDAFDLGRKCLPAGQRWRETRCSILHIRR